MKTVAGFTAGQQVTVADPYENRTYTLKKPTRLCNPVSKDGEDVEHPDAHLMCYQVKKSPGQPRHQKIVGLIHTNNSFGPGQLDTLVEGELCVPALTNP